MKLIDALDKVQSNTNGEVYRSELIEILQYLDDHPELTGRDRTESELKAISDRTRVSEWAVRAVTTALGHGVIPDPKPTNTERIKELLEMAQKDNASQSYTRFAEYLDEHGVVAPGGDDES